MRAAIILLLGVVAASAFPRNGQRIVGGSLTDISQYPDMASLLFSSGSSDHRHSCGGIIINNRSVLTSAHCTFRNRPDQWRSRVGSTLANSGGTVINSALLIRHPNYNTWSSNNDISIIRTATAIPFGNLVRIARIAGPNYYVPDNTEVWAAGWGRTAHQGPASEQLRHVQMWVVNQEICRQRYFTISQVITANMICAGHLDVGGRDQCQGDSGGPVYHNGVVVGITSFGFQCALPFFPGVNTRVSRYIDWIANNS